MNRLARAISFNRRNTYDKIKRYEEEKNKEIIIREDFNKSLNEWKIPEYSTSKIYKNTGSFIRKTDVIVKTVEEVIPLSEE